MLTGRLIVAAKTFKGTNAIFQQAGLLLSFQIKSVTACAVYVYVCRADAGAAVWAGRLVCAPHQSHRLQHCFRLSRCVSPSSCTLTVYPLPVDVHTFHLKWWQACFKVAVRHAALNMRKRRTAKAITRRLSLLSCTVLCSASSELRQSSVASTSRLLDYCSTE